MKGRVQATVLAMALAAASRAGMLEVTRQLWGVDGKVVPGRLNLLSLEVANLWPAPFDGVLRLRKADAAEQRLGARLVAPCYLTPGARRWVQFYPYVSGEYETWTVEWGRGADARVELRRPDNGPPGRALLRDPDDPLARMRKAAFPVLWDHLFPSTVAATDGIHSLVLDHAPRWEPVREQAFIDWLRAGGQLHLCHDANGRYPAFTGELEPLNQPLDRFRVGSGLVARHATTQGDLTDESLAAQGYPSPSLQESDGDVQIYSLEDALFNNLKAVTRPEHNWALIYLTTLGYMALVGPVHYLFGRKRRDYRLTVLFYLLTVGGCAWLLGFIGRRGHGEATQAHAVAYARQLDPDHYDVTQWMNVFVTRGATYAITHAAPHNLYSTCESVESVGGAIFSGKGGVFRVDIPLFSSRPLLHRGKLQGHHIALRVAEWQGEEQLRKLVLDVEPGFPEDVEQMWACHCDVWYPVTLWSGKLKALIASGKRSEDFFGSHEFKIHSYQWRGWGYEEEEHVSLKARYKRFLRPLLARAVSGTKAFYRYIYYPARELDCAHLFFYVRSPEAFAIQGDRFGTQHGYVLYHAKVFKPEKPDE